MDIASPLLVLLFLLFNKKEIKGGFKWFVYYLLSIFLFSAITQIFDILNKHKTSNLLFYHFNCIFFVFLLSKYFDFCIKSKASRILDVVFLVPFIILSLLNFIYLKRTFTIYGLTSIWVSIKCLSFYEKKLSSPTRENILESRNFWIFSGLFLYFSVTFIIFITYDFLTIGYLKGNYDWIGNLWKIHNGILFLSCLFYIKAIKCKE